MSSRIPGFYRLPPEARLSALESALGRDLDDFRQSEGLSLEAADMMVENVIGTFKLPNAVGINLKLNGKDVVVPMVVEEPSVVAAVSNMARLTRAAGGIFADSDPSLMIGQIQVIGTDPKAMQARLQAALPQLEEKASKVHPRLVDRGGGMRGITVRQVHYDEPGEDSESYVVLHFVLDCVDAMGANMVNTVAETLAPDVESISGGRVGLRILSNLADQRLARARVHLRPEHLDHGDLAGEEVARGIAEAYRFAYADPYRAATHNKGIMNGVDAVALATGNDWRAIEAGAHAYAARSGQYRSLSQWKIAADGSLHGSLELPVQVGTVGGPIRVHPTVQHNLKLLGITKAAELAQVMAAVGLVQNLGALRALATEGIQQGHVRMHARSVAAAAGATGAEVHTVAQALHLAKNFSAAKASAILAELRA